MTIEADNVCFADHAFDVNKGKVSMTKDRTLLNIFWIVYYRMNQSIRIHFHTLLLGCMVQYVAPSERIKNTINMIFSLA